MGERSRASIVSLCLALGVGIAVMGAGAAERGAASFRQIVDDGRGAVWLAGSDGVVLTYAIADRVMTFAGSDNCPQVSSLDRLEASSGLEKARVTNEIRASFAAWARVADIAFREVDDPALAQIVIGAQGDPDGHAFTDLYFMAATDGVRAIDRALICLNPLKRWKIGFDGDLQVYDLRYTITHEIGHAIGLDHPDGFDNVMSMRYDERFETLQAGDIAGARFLYGAPAARGIFNAAEKGRGTDVPPPLLVDGPVRPDAVLPVSAE